MSSIRDRHCIYPNRYSLLKNKMKKLLLTYLIIFLIVSLGLSQNSKSIKNKILYYEVKLTNVDFSIGDTLIQYSLLVEPTGEIGFEEGYDFSLDNISRVRFKGKRRRQKACQDTIISNGNEPLKLTSYFPPLNQDSHFLKVDGSKQYFIEYKTTSSYFAGMRHYRSKDGWTPENAFPWIVSGLYMKKKRKNRL